LGVGTSFFLFVFPLQILSLFRPKKWDFWGFFCFLFSSVNSIGIFAKIFDITKLKKKKKKKPPVGKFLGFNFIIDFEIGGYSAFRNANVTIFHCDTHWVSR